MTCSTQSRYGRRLSSATGKRLRTLCLVAGPKLTSTFIFRQWLNGYIIFDDDPSNSMQLSFRLPKRLEIPSTEHIVSNKFAESLLTSQKFGTNLAPSSHSTQPILQRPFCTKTSPVVTPSLAIHTTSTLLDHLPLTSPFIPNTEFDHSFRYSPPSTACTDAETTQLPSTT